MSVVQKWVDSGSVSSDFVTMHKFEGTGIDTYDINFSGGYIVPSHVKAMMTRSDGTGYEQLGVTFLTPARVKLSKIVPVGWDVVIYRDTPKDKPMLQFSDGSLLTGKNMDTQSKQAIFAVAEMVDRFENQVISTEQAVSASQAAQDAAQAAAKSASNAEKAADKALAESANTLKADLAKSTGAAMVGAPTILTKLPKMTLADSFVWANEVGIPAKFFGIKGDGSATDSDRIQDAADAGTVVKFPRGTFVSAGVVARAGTAFIGVDWGTVIKLAAGANKSLITVSDAPNTSFSHLKLDGNKDMQTLGKSVRALYYIGDKSTWGRIDRVWCDNVLDHGFMHSVGSAGAWNIYTGCKATRCGSAAHSAAGGPGGTGFAAGGEGVKHVWGHAEDCQLNGWKSPGAYHERLVAANCSSGYETGFLSQEDRLSFTEYHSVRAIGCGVGMSHQGAAYDILVRNFITDRTDGAAVRLLGGVKRFRMYDSIINNFGQRLEVNQKDAIIVGQSASKYEDIDIDNNQFIINDGIDASDRWALRLVEGVDNLRFGSSNVVRGARGVNLHISTTPATDIGNFKGNSGRYKLTQAATLLATGDFIKHTILGRERVAQEYSLRFTVEVSGTESKTIYLKVGPASIPIMTSTDSGNMYCEVKLTPLLGKPGVRVVGSVQNPVGAVVSIGTVASIPQFQDMEVGVSASISGGSAALRSFTLNLI